MSRPAKMSPILPTPWTVTPGLAQQRQVVRAPRLEREVVAVRRALVVARLADERPRDHAADGVLAGEDLARDPAGLVELLERDRLLVRGDLEDRVGGRVDDPLARLLVLLAELLDDLRPRRRLVADHAARGAVHERVDHVVREAVRVRRQRLRRDDPHQLPVAERRVLALRALDQPAGDRGRARPAAGSPRAPRRCRARAPRGSGRSRPPTARATFPSVSEPSSPNSAGVRQRSRADGVEHDHARARQWVSWWDWWMPGAREPSQARTQGACGLVSPDATEDDAWRRVLASRRRHLAGRPTGYSRGRWTRSWTSRPGRLHRAVIASRPASRLVVRISPTRDPKTAKPAR